MELQAQLAQTVIRPAQLARLQQLTALRVLSIISFQQHQHAFYVEFTNTAWEDQLFVRLAFPHAKLASDLLQLV